jgi:enoyl-CoA hydratase/carnithine racemase
MSYETIIYEVDNKVLTITLNRPDRLNAFTGVMMRELIDAFDRADADDDVRVIIITGAGRGFCAGADLGRGEETFEGESGRLTEGDGGGRVSRRIFRLLKPIIAAINGPAVGVGMTMTLPMDIRIASETAKMGMVFSRRGIVPEACSTWFLPRIVGINQAAEWVYSGRVFPATEALAGGYVRSLHKPDELLGVANELAREIADNTSSISVALARQMMWRLLGADDPVEAHNLDSLGMDWMGKQADAREGVASFLEKRPPNFPDKVSENMPPYFPWWEERKLNLG